MSVRQEYPNISLGTVYRNLNLLADLGDAIKITAPNGGVHFDGRIEPHYHFYCNKCGRVIDLDIEQLDCINEAAGKNFDGVIENHTMMFYGTCNDCIKSE
jgi:Fur family peroxide stress response transcriptional regulator